MSSDSDIDLTALTREQVLVGMGDLLLSMLGTHRVALAVMSEEGAVTFLNPMLILNVKPEELASGLVDSWDEEEIAKLLEHVYG